MVHKLITSVNGECNLCFLSKKYMNKLTLVDSVIIEIDLIDLYAWVDVEVS